MSRWRSTGRGWSAYTPPAFRGTDRAASHTALYYEYHDFGLSKIWVEISADGGQTWAPTSVSDSGTYYEPWLAAGGNGGVDVVYYDTPYVAGAGRAE